jgi:hypothetical protein
MVLRRQQGDLQRRVDALASARAGARRTGGGARRLAPIRRRGRTSGRRTEWDGDGAA